VFIFSRRQRGSLEVRPISWSKYDDDEEVGKEIAEQNSSR